MRARDVIRAYLRKLVRSNQSVEAGVSGPSFHLPMSLRDEPVAVRRNLDPRDPSPLYEMQPARLMGWYHGYRDSYEFQQSLLYAETVALTVDGLVGIEPDAISVNDIRVTLDPRPYQLPTTLQPHQAAMLGYFRASGRLRVIDGVEENNRSARLAAVDRATATLRLQEASYFDQIATNLSADTVSGALIDPITRRAVGTLREGIEAPEQGRLRPLERSAMANTLGVAAVLFTREGMPLLRRRNSHLGSINMTRGIHCSVSGVLELPPGFRRGQSGGFEVLAYGMRHEIAQELALAPHEYRLFPVALARELPRLGKPQLFFLIECDLETDELCRRLHIAPERHEYLNDPARPFLLQPLDFEHAPQFTYEGWAAAWFAAAFRSANAVDHRPSIDHPGIGQG